MVIDTKFKYANSLSNYYVIMMLQNLRKIQKKNRKFPIFFAFPRHECRAEANNNREAVVVYARHVVKRTSKRSALVYIFICLFVCYGLIEEIGRYPHLTFGIQG